MGTNIQSYPTLQSDHARGLSSPSRKTCATVFQREVLLRPSSLAMIVSERSFQFTRQGRSRSESAIRKRTILSSLLWVMQWVLRFALGNADDELQYFDQEPQPLSRTHARLVKRLSQRAGRPVRLRAPALFGILCKGMPYPQRNELLVRLSLLGRVRVYGIRFMGAVSKACARLMSFEHGGWSMPSTAAVAGGLWEVQLPPN